MSTSTLFHGAVFFALFTVSSTLGANARSLRSQIGHEHQPHLALHAVEQKDAVQVFLQKETEQSGDVKDWIWLVAIPISLLGSTMTVFGLLIQKMSQEPDSETEDIEDRQRSTYYCFNCLWIGGFTMFATGNSVTWVAIGLAPNSVLSVFNSWNIVLTLIVAPRIFKNEYVSWRTIYCCGILVLGCCWVAIFGPRSYRLETLHHLRQDFQYPAFRTCSFFIVIFYVSSVVKYLEVRRDQVWDTFTVARIAWAASISASYATIFSKCTSVLFQSSVATGRNQIQGEFWLYLAITFFCGLSQVHFLNEGLSHGAASFVIPVYESTAMLISIVVGGMLFQEYAHFSLMEHVCFWPGVATVLCGIFALTISADEDKREKKESLDKLHESPRSIEKAEDRYETSTAGSEEGDAPKY